MAMNRAAQRTALLELGAAVAEDMKSGQPAGDKTRAAMDVLSVMPEASVEVMTLIEKEARKKRPDGYLVAGLAFVAGQALELLRYGLERDDPVAATTLGEARRRLVAHARSDRADANVLMLIAKQFAAAKLDIGEPLRDAMGQLMAQRAEAGSDEGDDGDADMERQLTDLAAALRGDPFAIHMELAETASSFPTEHRIAMAALMLASTSSAVREAALGWLFDAAPDVRAAIAGALAEKAGEGRLDGATLRRLVSVRNWLPVEDRDRVDACIKAARRKGVEPEALPAVKVEQAVASPFDGSGAGSAFAVVRVGRRYAVVSLLFKFSVGLRDAWVARDLGETAASAMLDQVAGEIDVNDASLDHVGRALRHFLSLHVVAGTLPPFGVLGCIETLGLGAVNPQAFTLEEAIAEGLVAVSGHETIAAALARSADWIGHFGFMDSWFEDDALVDGALKGRKSLARARKIDVVLESVVEPRRRRWGELLAWTALVAAEAEDGRQDATAFAMVAGEILSDRPVREIPLLRGIAAATIEARRLRRR